MFTKRSVIVVLAAVNLVLLAALLIGSFSLPPAVAQGAPGGGGFACVTAKAAGQSYDVLYVLDVAGRKLYGFYPAAGQPLRLKVTPPRDLAGDFGSK